MAARGHGLGVGLTEAVPAAEHHGPPMIGIELPEPVPQGLVDSLAEHAVYPSVRSSWLRVAPHHHTTQADVDQLFAALDAALGFGGTDDAERLNTAGSSPA